MLKSYPAIPYGLWKTQFILKRCTGLTVTWLSILSSLGMGELWIFPSFSVVLLPTEAFTNEGLWDSVKCLCRSSHQSVSIICFPLFKRKQGSFWVFLVSLGVWNAAAASLEGTLEPPTGASSHIPHQLSREILVQMSFTPRAESGNLELDYPGYWWSKATRLVLWADFILVLYMKPSNNLLENSLQFSKCELMNMLFLWPLPHKLPWS